MSFIRLEEVSFGYIKTCLQISNVTLEFNCGTIAMLTGKNGSGKTTLSKLMMGILKPQKGSILVDGQDICKQNLADTAKKTGYLFQNPERQLFCTSVLEEIAFSFRQRGQDEDTSMENAKELLKRFSMAGKAGEYPLRLSGGEKQRLALLCVFALKPKYYILDEPSSGIDRDNKEILMGMLRNLKAEGAGICIITHDKMLINNLSDRVITMEKGQVINDETA